MAARDYLKIYIRRVLRGYTWLDFWLQDHGISHLQICNNPDRLKATRLAWIDWLIQCYEEQLK